jgi:hypothetical protein
MGDSLGGSPQPQPTPSPILDLLKTIGSGALAVPKGIAQGFGDLTIGPEGYNRDPQEIIARIVQTMLLGENVGAQLAKVQDYNKQDALYRQAPDTQTYRDLATSGGQAALDRYYGAGAVPPFSTVPREGVGTPSALDPTLAGQPVQGQATRPAWGGPTLEERQDTTNAVRSLNYADMLHRAGLSKYSIVTVKNDKNGVPTLSIADRPSPLFDSQDPRLDPRVLAEHGWRPTPPMPLPDGTLGVTLEQDPALEAARKARAVGEAKYLPPGSQTSGGIPGTAPAISAGSSPASGGSIAAPSIGATPDMSVAQMALAGDVATKNIQLQYDQERQKMAATLKGATYNEDDLKRLNQIATARGFLNAFEDYAQHGTANDPTAPPQERFPSSLPTERVSGAAAITELGRQNSLLQGALRDPFLRNYRGYQGLAKPILSRSIGGDVGNLSEQEQKAVEGVMNAISVPEVKDTVRQLRRIIDAREAEIVKGKSASGLGAAPATAAPTSAVRQKLLERFPPRR